MDLGIHLTLDDPNTIADPEVIATADSVNATMSNAFGKVWDLFTTLGEGIATDTFEVRARSYTQPEVVQGTTAGGTLWDNVATLVGLPITSSTIDRLTIGDVLKIDNEIVVVKAINRSTNVIDVYERGAGESAPATHGTGAKTIKIIGNAAVEGRVDVEAMAEAGNLLTNYTQLFEEKVDLSFEDDNTARKIGNTRDVLKREAMTRVMRDLARTAIDGVAVAPTRTTPSLTRGLDRWLNLAGGLVTNVGGAFTEGTLQTALATIRLAGGMPNAIVMSVAKKATFNGFTGAGVTQVAMDAGNTTVGRITNAYLADGFGELPIIVDLDMPDDKVYIVNSNKMFKGWKKNDELRFVPETNTNSREKAETLQGRMGLAVEGVGTDHMVLAGLS